MTDKYNEYPPLILGDKVIDPAGADYRDAMGYEYYFGIMEMWDRMGPDYIMMPLKADNTGKLFYWDSFYSDESPWSILDNKVQTAFQNYIMDKIILDGVAHNRSDCDTRRSV